MGRTLPLKNFKAGLAMMGTNPGFQFLAEVLLPPELDGLIT
jgi:hypothetical protein